MSFVARQQSKCKPKNDRTCVERFQVFNVIWKSLKRKCDNWNKRVSYRNGCNDSEENDHTLNVSQHDGVRDHSVFDLQYRPQINAMSLWDRNFGTVNMIINYFEWSSSTSFFCILFSFVVGFFVITLIFCIVITAINGKHMTKLDENGDEVLCLSSNEPSTFRTAFTLSWTTFSTVGYGHVSPGTDQNIDCTILDLICAVESFFGILYAGFCSAVLFAKVLRARSTANVGFSRVMCLQYGDHDVVNFEEVSEYIRYTSQHINEHISEHMEEGLRGDGDCFSSYPVLDFRIVNTKCNSQGGEILNAKIDSVVVTPVSSSDRDHLRILMERNKSDRIENPESLKFSSTSDINQRCKRPVIIRRKHARRNLKRSTSHDEIPSSSAKRLFKYGDQHGNNYKRIMEGYPSKQFEKRSFQPIKLETSQHPYFDRTWLVRHVLDLDSPLLTRDAQERIIQNGNIWPQERNTVEDIREGLRDFTHIIISFTGISKSSGSTVYAQKIYHTGDIVIGYKFAEMFYKDSHSGELRVDQTYTSDFVHQGGNIESELLCNVCFDEKES